MEIIDNVNKTLKNDMLVTLRSGSKVTIVTSCFSINAYQELKEQLGDISGLRFIFTTPSFVTEKVDEQCREFTSPWQLLDNITLLLNGLNLDAVWQNIIAFVSKLEVTEGSTHTEQIRIDEERTRIIRPIKSLERLMRSNAQPRCQRELYSDIKKLKALL